MLVLRSLNSISVAGFIIVYFPIYSINRKASPPRLDTSAKRYLPKGGPTNCGRRSMDTVGSELEGRGIVLIKGAGFYLLNISKNIQLYIWL